MLNWFSIFLKLFSFAIILNLHNEAVSALSISRPKRSLGVKEWYHLWPEGRIPYIIDSSSFEGPERRLIKQAMREWERSTCIKFMDRTEERVHPDYIYISKSDAECYTYGVGRTRVGRNYVNLGENCLTKRIILHELGHIIGLHHEHKRPDRDEYVKVNMDNVKTDDGTRHNFEKLPSEGAIMLNETYDLKSIMHYETNAFARDRSKNTITPLKTEDFEITQIGRRSQLSDIDISGVNRLYNCSECRTLLEGDSGTFDVAKDLNTSTSSTKHCEWRIVGAPGERVIFNLSSWSIPNSKDCQADYFRVNDDFRTPGNNLLIEECETDSGMIQAASKNNQLLITFHTNTFNSQYFGFTGNFWKTCENTIEINERGKEYYLESPGFPNEYPAGKYCVWHLVAPYYEKLILKFNYFELESSDNCENDFVEIRNGQSYYSPLIGKYCNNISPGVIRSGGEALYIHFRSNRQIQQKGFSAIATLRSLYY